MVAQWTFLFPVKRQNTVHTVYQWAQTYEDGRLSLRVIPVHVCQGLVKRVLSDPFVS